MSKATILIVDQNRQTALYLASSLLPSLGYSGYCVGSGKDALTAIRNTKYALLLLDSNLPDITGLQLLQQLKEEGYSLPTVFMTDSNIPETEAAAFQLGVQDYLIKPFEASRLLTAITQAINETRLHQQTELLMEQLKDPVSWMTILSKVGQSVTSTLELNEVLRRIVEAGVQLTRAEEGFLALLDEQSGQLYMRAIVNIDKNRFKTLRLPLSDSLLGTVIRTGQPIRTTRSVKEPPLKVTTGFLVHSILHVPILSKGHPLGVLSVANNRKPREFQLIDETLLTSLADYAAVAIENAHLYEQAQQEISERKRIEEALRVSEKRYELAVRGANDGLWDWDLKTNQIYYSPRWKAMLGYGENEIGQSLNEWFDRIHPEDVEHTKLALSAHLTKRTSHFENEHRMLHKDGNYRWMLSRGLAVWDSEVVPNRMAGSQTDFTDRKTAEEKLLRDAFYDGLTGLANRALFMDRLKSAIERKKRQAKYSFAVLFLDLDRFKDINDSLGHMVGDQLLIAIAKRLKQGLRTTDTVARLGGDEFVILLEEVHSIDDAIRIADWIQASLSTPFQLAGQDVFITTSIGIVLSAPYYNHSEEVLRDADIAMYAAKESGKARHKIFAPAMRDRLIKRLSLETELRQAIEHHELQVYYQPIVALATRQITGLEALVRWHHPAHGLFSSTNLITLAEETGIILLIDNWILAEAGRQMKEWQAEFPGARELAISVNISYEQLTHPKLAGQIEKILQDSGISASHLKLEVTENALNQAYQFSTEVFSRLRDLGVGILIDDFGIGFSSLSYLSSLPIHALKIAPTFVSKATKESNQLKIVQTIVKLSHDLGMEAIAEGIETEEQWQQLKSLRCEYGQGYYICRPMDRQGITTLLAEVFSGKRTIPVKGTSPLLSSPNSFPTPGGLGAQ